MDTKQVILKRLKSLLWRSGVLFLVALINFVMENLGLVKAPPLVVTVVGLLAGEATKFLNNHTEIFGAKLK